MGELLSPEEAAKLLNVSPQWVRKLLNKGSIEGQKVGKNWATTEANIQAYKRQKEAIAASKKAS